MKSVPYFIRRPCSELVIHSPLARKPIYRIKGKLLGAKGPSDLYICSYETDPLTRKISLTDGNCD